MAVPYIFQAGTTIRANEVNANFAALASGFTGGEISGSIYPNADNTLDLGTALAAFRNIYVYNLRLADPDGSHFLTLTEGSNLTANRTLTFITGDSDRTFTLTGNSSIGGTAYVVGGTDVALADGGTGASLADPGADRLLFWDESGGAVTWLTAGTGLVISGTTISTSGGGLSILGTNNTVVRMDGTTNIQDSAVTIDDSGNTSTNGTLNYGATSVMSYINKSMSTAYLANTDGFVVMIVDGSGGAGTGYGELLSDSSNPPTTFKARADVISGSRDSRMIPIKAGQYFKANEVVNSGSIVYTLNFVPLGTGGV